MSSAYRKLLNAGYFPVCYEDDPHPSTGEENATPGERFLFDKFRSHLSLNANIPRRTVFDTMDNYAYSFFGEFTETTDNELFKKITPAFYEYLFGNDEVYVSYESLDELLNQIDAPDTHEEVKRVREDFIIPKEPEFQLGYRGGKDPQGVYVFCHLKTGLNLKRPNGQEIYIVAEYDGRKSNRGTQFHNLAQRIVIEKQNISLLAHLCIKRSTILLTENDDSEIKGIIDSVFNGHPFCYDKKETTHIIPNQTQFIEPEQVATYQEAIFAGGDKELTELGKLINANSKSERLTTGENYKEMTTIANRQRIILNKLEEFANNCSERGGIQLEFKVTGIPEKEPMETDPEMTGEAMSQPQEGGQF